MIGSILDKAKQYNYTYNAYRDYSHLNKLGKLIDLVKFVFEEDIVLISSNKSNCAYKNYADQFVSLLEHLNVSELSYEYLYPLDTKLHRSLVNGEIAIASVTPDYNRILTNSLEDFCKEISVLVNEEFKESLLIVVDSIMQMIERTTKVLDSGDERKRKISTYLKRIIDKKTETLDEAVQRILFFNALLWQNRHQQNGLGRLDFILFPYFKKDIDAGVIDIREGRQMLERMISILGKDYNYKSATLKGDTGQVIILGGKDSKGNEVKNELTHMFLDIFSKKPVPDPKLLLKVSHETTEEIWSEAIDCILNGAGSPLLLNDTLIQDRMKEFGYEIEDVWNFGTSACWEPLIIGKSFDQNNRVANIPIINASTISLKDSTYSNFEDYFRNVKEEVINLVAKADVNIRFDKSPLLTLLFDDCIRNEKDFCDGGAKYNYHGLLVVGFPNLVNAVLNVKEFVFDKKLITQEHLRFALEADYYGHEDIRYLLRNGSKHFGQVDDEVIGITNELMNAVSDGAKKVCMFGNKVKVGFSSPGYIDIAKTVPASPDGRYSGNPLSVHISPSGSDIDITSIMDFASCMDYGGNRINGNVIDFIIPSSYTKEKQKLVAIVKNGFLKGDFEMQLNVLDKKTLIDAKEHPEKYPNLIVRVWGFSAYFNDLPESYKDNLIERACKYEA